ncbi:arylsulfatase [Flavobacterium sp. C4GT6]|uniref:arylsulfatase n=1 Tax=Flavobacterium sp. C4GT6 TaxID=3103818 RepID=UPI002ED5F683
MKHFFTFCIVISFMAVSCNNSGKKENDTQNEDREGSVLPRPNPEFKGKIGETFETSTPDFPQPYKAKEGAPNIVIILLDDIGFGQPSVNGGLINTPVMDSLKNIGLYYNRFHTTGICSPTRAALLTGRNHHQSGNGTITELSTGYPGYNSMWGKDLAAIPEVLSQYGYSTSAYGKWHNTPDWETSAIGPYDRWPTGIGFEHFYGFFGGETSQWEPQLILNTQAIEPPSLPEEGYHLGKDMTDQAITWMKTQKSIAPEQPFFTYYATGAAHAPHHAPKEWIDKYKGKFDMGWDKYREIVYQNQLEQGIIPQGTKLTERPKEIPSWDSQSADAKKLFARQMEVFAGFLEYTDYQIGRLLKAINELPDADNTLVFFIVGDNGSSAEGSMSGTSNNMYTQNGFPDTVESQLAIMDELGGPKHENHFAVPWSWAGGAPFQWMKRVPSHFGGTRNSMIITWPQGIAANGETRSQFHHVIDIAPTIYDVLGITFPTSVNGVEQVPLAGVSMKYTFENGNAEGTRKIQYFETGGHRAIYNDGWVAASFHGAPWILTGSKGFKDNQWELYNIKDDFSEAVDLAAKNPEKLKELQQLFDEEAKKYNVYPLDDRFAQRAQIPDRPSNVKGKTKFEYSQGVVRIPEGSAPPIYARSHDVTVIGQNKGNNSGVLAAEGGGAGGWTLYVKNGKVYYDYNFFGKEIYSVASNTTLPKGNFSIKMVYTQTGKEYGDGGTAELFIDGKPVGKGDIPKVVPVRFSATETLDIGTDLGALVSDSYGHNNSFNGVIDKVIIELK